MAGDGCGRAAGNGCECRSAGRVRPLLLDECDAGSVAAAGLFDLADQPLEIGDLLAQRGQSTFGEADPGAWSFPRIAFADPDQTRVLEGGQVLGQVAAGQFERGAQVAELDLSSLVGDGEDAQAYALR
jgi:hypothetical protein